MTLTLIGDSNFRDLVTYHKEEIESKIGRSLSFVLASSVATVKTILDNQAEIPDIVFIASPTNEISLKSRNNTKSREGIIETVITELYQHVNVTADKHEKSTNHSALHSLRTSLA